MPAKAVEKEKDEPIPFVHGLILHSAEPIIAQADGDGEGEEEGWKWRVELIRAGEAKAPQAAHGPDTKYFMEDSALASAKTQFHNSPCYVHTQSQHQYSPKYYSERDKAGFYNNVAYKDQVITTDLLIANTAPGRDLRELLLLGWKNNNKGIVEFSAAYQAKHRIERETDTDDDGWEYTTSRTYYCEEILNLVSVDVVRKGNYETQATTMLQSLDQEAEMPAKVTTTEDPKADDKNKGNRSQPPTTEDFVTQENLDATLEERNQKIEDELKGYRDKEAQREKETQRQGLIVHLRDEAGKVESFNDFERIQATQLIMMGIDRGIFPDTDAVNTQLKEHIDLSAQRIEADKKTENANITRDKHDKEILAVQAYAEQKEKIDDVPAVGSLYLFLKDKGIDIHNDPGDLYGRLMSFHQFIEGNFSEDDLILRQGDYTDLITHEISGTTGWAAVISTALFRAMAAHPQTQRYKNWRAVVGRPKNAKALGENEFIVLGDYPIAPVKVEGAAYATPTTPDGYTITIDVKTRGYIEGVTIEKISRDAEGSLLQLMPRMYQAGHLTIFTLIFGLLRQADLVIDEDDTAIFTADHKNTGTAALNLANAKKAQSALMGLTPYGQVADKDILAEDNLLKHLIVPHDLYNDALGIKSLQADGSDNAAYNPFAIQDVKPIVDLTATDPTDWYAQSNPLTVESICAAFWKGISEPQIIPQMGATIDRVYNKDVFSYKLVIRFGAAIGNFRGLYRNEVDDS